MSNGKLSLVWEAAGGIKVTIDSDDPIIDSSYTLRVEQIDYCSRAF